MRLQSLNLMLAIICIYAANCNAEYNAIVNQKFNIGVFAVHQDLLYLAKMKGFEIVHNYIFEEQNNRDEDLRVYLNMAESLGLKVMVGFGREKGFEPKKTIQRVNRFKKHPALWAWYLYDEPPPEIYKKVEKNAEAIRSVDKKHPIIVATNRPEYIELADMSFSYCYPVKDKPFPYQDLRTYVSRIDSMKIFNKPLISLVQTFNWNHYLQLKEKKRKNRLPNLAEMRFMAYSSLIKGCRGIFFFSFQTLPIEFDHLNQEVVPLINEIKVIRPYLNYKSLNANDYVNSLTHINAKVWGDKYQALLVIINPTPNKTSFVIKMNYKKILDLQQKDRIVHKIEKLNPWGARIYLFNGKILNENTIN